jgi:hypothetical protein
MASKVTVPGRRLSTLGIGPGVAPAPGADGVALSGDKNPYPHAHRSALSRFGRPHEGHRFAVGLRTVGSSPVTSCGATAFGSGPVLGMAGATPAVWAGAASGLPQEKQKRACSGFRLPHREQNITNSRQYFV